MSAVEDYLGAHSTEALDDLKAFCRIPSVSTDPAYRNGIRAGACFVAERLKRAGFSSVEISETGGFPPPSGGTPKKPTDGTTGDTPKTDTTTDASGAEQTDGAGTTEKARDDAARPDDGSKT